MRCSVLRSAGNLMLVALSTILLSTPAGAAAAKTHVITFGKTVPVKWFSANDETQPRILKVHHPSHDWRSFFLLHRLQLPLRQTIKAEASAHT